MEVLMKRVTKPIPNNPLHKESDEMLGYLLALNRGRLKIGRFDIEECSQTIKEIYQILG